MIGFHPSITNSILAMGLMAIAARPDLPRDPRHAAGSGTAAQNLIEFIYESLANFAVGMGGKRRPPLLPLFAGFFLLIMFCNWTGLILRGKIESLRAPTSDINITIGLALVTFVLTSMSRASECSASAATSASSSRSSDFSNGIGDGLIDLYVGLIEFLLEFFKPVTLCLRLWGNLYGGEIMLASSRR